MKLLEGETNWQAVERIALGLVTFGIMASGLFVLGYFFGYVESVKQADPEKFKATVEILVNVFTNLHQIK